MAVYIVKVIPHSTEPPDDLPDAKIRRARVHERKSKSGKEKGEVIQHCWESLARKWGEKRRTMATSVARRDLVHEKESR